jgi:hypothetical protein
MNATLQRQLCQPQQQALGTRALRLICFDGSAFLPFAENGRRKSIKGGSASPKTMVTIAEGADIQPGQPHANALRTTRSTLAILRDDAAFLSLAENRGAREYKRWIGWKARPLLRIRYGSEDDGNNRRRRRY